MSNYKLLYTTCRSLKDAKKIGDILVKNKLAACTNIISSVNSIFLWKNKTSKSKEVILIGKTQKKNMDKIMRTIKQNHSYECPAILFFNIDHGSKDFLKWIKNNS